MGCCPFVSEGTFVDSGDCGDVVTAGGYGGVASVEVVREHHGLQEESTVFEVAVGDGSGRIIS